MSRWFGSKQTDSSSVQTHHKSLHITASNSYDDLNAQTVPINSDIPLSISSEYADTELLIRIKDFKGSKAHHSNDPKSSEYFNKRLNTNISIQVTLRPKRTFTGDNLLFGNDFGYPIKDYLPYGVSTGFKLFKWYVDPSVDGDLFIDDPYLYGKALSSFNVINDSNDNGDSKVDGVDLIDEDLTKDEDLTIPVEPAKRQVFFQTQSNQNAFIFQEGGVYKFDFFSGLISLDNSDFNINLPGGYSLNLSSYLNDKFNRVRYVLKLREGSDQELGVAFGVPLLIINFELLDDEDDQSSVLS